VKHGETLPPVGELSNQAAVAASPITEVREREGRRETVPLDLVTIHLAPATNLQVIHAPRLRIRDPNPQQLARTKTGKDSCGSEEVLCREAPNCPPLALGWRDSSFGWQAAVLRWHGVYRKVIHPVAPNGLDPLGGENPHALKSRRTRLDQSLEYQESLLPLPARRTRDEIVQRDTGAPRIQ